MRQKKYFMKLIYYGVFICLISYPKITFGQTIKRECISSYGFSGSVGQVYIAQTIGQTYSTKPKHEDKSYVIQGFQQSNTFKLEIIDAGLTDILELKVYPNPAKYSVVISSQEILETCYLDIYDEMGRPILNKEIENMSRYELNCESWDDGIYIVKVYDKDQKQQTLKLIISK